jgi:hypothetical protein
MSVTRSVLRLGEEASKLIIKNHAPMEKFGPAFYHYRVKGRVRDRGTNYI